MPFDKLFGILVSRGDGAGQFINARGDELHKAGGLWEVSVRNTGGVCHQARRKTPHVRMPLTRVAKSWVRIRPIEWSFACGFASSRLLAICKAYESESEGKYTAWAVAGCGCGTWRLCVIVRESSAASASLQRAGPRAFRSVNICGGRKIL